MSTWETLNINVELTDTHEMEGTDLAKIRIEEADSSGNGGYYSIPLQQLLRLVTPI